MAIQSVENQVHSIGSVTGAWLLFSYWTRFQLLIRVVLFIFVSLLNNTAFEFAYGKNLCFTSIPYAPDVPTSSARFGRSESASDESNTMGLRANFSFPPPIPTFAQFFWASSPNSQSLLSGYQYLNRYQKQISRQTLTFTQFYLRGVYNTCLSFSHLEHDFYDSTQRTCKHLYCRRIGRINLVELIWTTLRCHIQVAWCSFEFKFEE